MDISAVHRPAFHRTARLTRLTCGGAALALFAALVAMLAATSRPSDALTPPGGEVSTAPITAEQLLRGTKPSGLTRNDRFAAPRGATRAPDFVGRLELAGSTMGVISDAPGGGISNPVHGKDTTSFPDVKISFFTAGSRLVPTTQDVIRRGVLPHTRTYWDVIVQPGRVWTQPGDHGWHRASFPFALVNSIEGETHTGLALFLYRGNQVSHVRYQVVQMTAPFDVPEYFSAWGTTRAAFTPGVAGVEAARDRYWAEQRALWPEAPLSALRGRASPESLDAYSSYSDVIMSAAVVGGRIYRTSCPTSAGPLPYCSNVRYGVWSVTKSAWLNVAMMRLAQKYGAGIIDEPIARYVEQARRPGWRDVTFGDLANMASGHGPEGDPTCYLCDYTRWYVAPSEREKVAEALDYPRFTEPGTRYNYRDQDAFLLAVAEDRLLKAHEGPRASIWTMLRKEVYGPLGIFHAPTNATIERWGPGLAMGAYGYYPTLDDLAKIAALYQNGGRWDGRQILDASLVRKLLTKPVVAPEALPDVDDETHHYLYDWHLRRVEPTAGCTRHVPQMEGWGGNTVTVLPGRTTLIRMRNNWVGDPSDPQVEINDLAARLVPLCS